LVKWLLEQVHIQDQLLVEQQPLTLLSTHLLQTGTTLRAYPRLTAPQAVQVLFKQMARRH